MTTAILGLGGGNIPRPSRPPERIVAGQTPSLSPVRGSREPGRYAMTDTGDPFSVPNAGDKLLGARRALVAFRRWLRAQSTSSPCSGAVGTRVAAWQLLIAGHPRDRQARPARSCRDLDYDDRDTRLWAAGTSCGIAATSADRCSPDPVAVVRPGVSGTWTLRDSGQ
jgi:hypothetical protein